MRLVVHAVQALDDRLLELVDDLGALAGVGVDPVDPLVVDLHLELLRPAAVAAEPGAARSSVRHACDSRRTVPDVLYEVDGRVATLTLNRPERLNAITPELIERPARGARSGAGATTASTRSACAAPGARSAPATTSAGAREAMEEAEGDRPWDPIADYAHDVPLRRRLHVAVALAEAGDRAGPRLLRRRRHRLRALLATSSSAPRTAASATRRRASGARRRR